MKEIIIKENEAGQRLDKFLGKLLKEAPMSFLYKMMRKKNIVLNGKKASGAEKLVLGDSIKLFLSDETYDKFKGSIEASDYEHLPKKELMVVYESEDLLMINKPAGMLSQKAQKGDVSANEYILQYLLEQGTVTKESLATFKPSICNRLDRNTSGILIAGKTLKGSQKMSTALKERTVQKYYRCIVKDNLTDSKKITGYLEKDEKSNQVTVTKEAKKDAKPIATEYRPIEQYHGYTLLEVHLITGRSHQIRAHLASIGHPIIGDTKYGDKNVNQTFLKSAGISHQLLHAYRLELEDKTTVIAEVPKEFEKAVTYIQSVRQHGTRPKQAKKRGK